MANPNREHKASMAQIIATKLTIHRFKKYKDKEVQLPKGLCLIAGTNNAGKSTFMHAFAIWEFCRTVVEMEKGYQALLKGEEVSKQGVGIAEDDFLPLDLPSLKHLWTNLKSQSESEKDGYTLWLELEWTIPATLNSRRLRFGLALANNRLFIKTLFSNVLEGDPIPRIAYVPPFAGIVAREQLHTSAMKRKLIGQGLSGAVMRNVLLEMYNANQRKREWLKGDKAKIPNAALKELRDSDPWEILQAILAKTFGTTLEVKPFFETYHTYIQVECWKVTLKNNRYQKVLRYNKRDIMVEGSGFLQWLNVLALTLDPENKFILLDEPDAHLHPSLQNIMVNELNSIAVRLGKQILFATHSPELIRSRKPSEILEFHGTKISQLSEETQKISLLAGIGSEYSPRINKLQKSKKVFFVENDSDADLLKIWASSLGLEFPEDVVIWPLTDKHPERRRLFLQLQQNIPGLRGISLRDRDDLPKNSVDDDLREKGIIQGDLLCLTWRMRYIEGYLLSPKAIAKATGQSLEEIINYVKQNFAIDLTEFNKGPNILVAFQNLEAKEVLEEHQKSLKKKYVFQKADIARNMSKDEIHSDIEIVLCHLNSLN